jgi:predicted metalloprotease with PDZ domain
MLAGLLLDAAVRRGSGGRRTLDDVARHLLSVQMMGRPRSATELDIRSAVVEAGGREAEREWERVVAGTEAITLLQVAEALRAVAGVDLAPPVSSVRPPKTLTTPNR